MSVFNKNRPFFGISQRADRFSRGPPPLSSLCLTATEGGAEDSPITSVGRRREAARHVSGDLHSENLLIFIKHGHRGT